MLKNKIYLYEKKAFSLIELLAVIGILIVLIGFVIPTVGKAMQKSNLAVAKSMIEKLEMAVRNYHTAFDKYPDDLSYKYIGQKLFSESYGALLPLMQFEDKWIYDKTSPLLDRVYKDPWGQEYIFMYDISLFVNAGDEQDLYNYMNGEGRLLELGVPGAILNDFKLSHGFLIWSKGPDMVSGSADDIGNWGKTRSKMI